MTGLARIEQRSKDRLERWANSKMFPVTLDVVEDVRLLVAVAKAAEDIDRALYLHRVGCPNEYCDLCEKSPVLREALAGLDGAP